jgi:hypothetical protein
MIASPATFLESSLGALSFEQSLEDEKVAQKRT